MSPWGVIAAFLLGALTGCVFGVVVGVAGERFSSTAPGRAGEFTSSSELDRLRARRAHPTSRPHPWN